MTMSSIQNRKSKIQNSFTLIELLVVVAIIAVLVALLLPALKNARDQAKTISCLGFYHQFAIATQGYMGDNQDWLPMPIYLAPGVEYHWDYFLSPYLKDGKIFKDPAAIGELDPRWPPNEVGGYGINCFWIDVDHGPRTSYWDNRDYKPAIVNEPAKEVVFCDNRGMWGVGPLLDTYPASVHVSFWGGGDEVDARRPRMAPRHNLSPNVMFLDLHAENVGDLAKEWSEIWISRAWYGPPSCWRPDWN